jgi:two-component system KDP operon response regulator KdpE
VTAASALVLIIEDDSQTRRFLRASLGGYGWRTAEAEAGKPGLAAAQNLNPDLIILDLGLPDLDGVAVVRSLRRQGECPILILSARDQERDKIEALDAGADDYLAKPFGTGELDARLRALLRRTARRAGGDLFTFGIIQVDIARRRVLRSGEEVRLTPTEFRLLALLVRNAGLVVTHRHLLREVWGPEHVHDSHYLRIYMGQLRHKLEEDPARPRFLLTEVGVGYRLLAGPE